METYCNTGSYRQKQRGVAIIFVLAAILAIGFIGTSILVITNNDLLGGIFAHKATESQFAAKSAIQRLQAELNSNPTSFIPMLTSLAEKKTKSWWVYGALDSFVTVSSTQRYKLEATYFDTAKNVLEVTSYGEGGDGRKSVKARLELFHFRTTSTTATTSGNESNFALFIGEVKQFPMNGPIDVVGNTRFPGNVNLDQSASGSRFRGVFRSSLTESTQMWRGTYRFDSTAYFGTRVTADGSLSMSFYGRTGFQDGIYGIGATNTMNFYKPLFVGGTVGGNAALKLNCNSQRVNYGTGFSFSGATWASYNDGGKTKEDPRWLKDSLYLGESCIPKVDASVIPANKKLSWKDIRDPGRWNYTGPLSHVPDAAPEVIDQIMANEIYQYAIDSKKDWHGIAVVDVDAPMATKRGIPNNILDSATLNLEGKSGSNSHATLYAPFSPAKSGTYPDFGSSANDICTLTTAKPISTGYVNFPLVFDTVPANFTKAQLYLTFDDLDLHGDSNYTSGSNRYSLFETAVIMDQDSNVLITLGPSSTPPGNDQLANIVRPLPDSIFKQKSLKLILKWTTTLKLIGGTKCIVKNSDEKVYNVHIDGMVDTNAATDTSIAIVSNTFNGKMIFLVNKGITLQPTSAGKFFTIDSSASLMIYGAPGSAVQNVGDWEFYRGYMHIDSGATVSMGGAANKVDQLRGAIHFRDSAKVVGWYPQNAGIPNIVYDPAVISGMNYDGLMKYECSDDNISGSNKLEVIFTPVAGEENSKVKSIRY